jgi:hypothetical protein
MALVRFRWTSGVEAFVPADCLATIRSLVECLQQVSVERPDAFQEVVVNR